MRKSKGSKSTPVAAIAGGSEELQPDIQTSADGPQDQELTATGRRKRKDTGTNRAQSRGWSDEEEKLFLEALDLHGRDWKAAAAHVGSRDARAFTSHAQKFFIKLAIAGKPVPAKVAESGHGYTLSGKPLDPTSSAARAYGLKPEILESESALLACSLHVHAGLKTHSTARPHCLLDVHTHPYMATGMCVTHVCSMSCMQPCYQVLQNLLRLFCI